MKGEISVLKVGIIGYGTIGQDVAKVIEEGRAGDVKLSAILVRNPDKLKQNSDTFNFKITNDSDEFFQLGLDLIIEAGGHGVVQQYGEQALRSGSDLIVVSMGAFSDRELFERIKRTARETGRRIILPSAAIAGLDRIAAAVQGPTDEIKLVSRKPPKAWYGTIAEEKVDLETISEPYCIFEGTARESARLFPESVNVSAALSLAGVGFEQTKVQVYVDPTITQNTHEISAKGHFGSCRIEVCNTPSPNNPKTGYIVAMSIIKVLKQQTEPLVVGV